eukprot:15484721-Alexandrium_andersonii.AAC.1
MQGGGVARAQGTRTKNSEEEQHRETRWDRTHLPAEHSTSRIVQASGESQPCFSPPPRSSESTGNVRHWTEWS